MDERIPVNAPTEENGSCPLIYCPSQEKNPLMRFELTSCTQSPSWFNITLLDLTNRISFSALHFCFPDSNEPVQSFLFYGGYFPGGKLINPAYQCYRQMFISLWSVQGGRAVMCTRKLQWFLISRKMSNLWKLDTVLNDLYTYHSKSWDGTDQLIYNPPIVLMSKWPPRTQFSNWGLVGHFDPRRFKWLIIFYVIHFGELHSFHFYALQKKKVLGLL